MAADLKAWRDKAGISQEELAGRTGNAVTTSTIYRIEKRTVVPMKLVKAALAAALNVAVDEIDWPTEAEVAPKREQRKQRKDGAQ